MQPEIFFAFDKYGGPSPQQVLAVMVVNELKSFKLPPPPLKKNKNKVKV